MNNDEARRPEGAQSPTAIRSALNALFQSGAATLARQRTLDAATKELRAQERLRRSKGSAAVTGEDAAVLRELARKIEDELRWRSRALVTIFTEQHCTSCNHSTSHLTGIMVEQEHKTDTTARRLLRSVSNHPLLPKRRETWIEEVEVCASCYDNAVGELSTIIPMPLVERRENKESAHANQNP